ncbi:MAG: sugar translocase [Bacillota bacterium]|nr:sugar translocase [Bacillota bacterium]
MAEGSRSQKTAKNMLFSVTSNIVAQALNFAVRTVFMYTLGVNYLGINGLFSNILTMLSLADLGIGVAMAHTYYKPLADRDEKRIRILTNFYSKVYTAIGLVVFVAGMSIMPFLHKIINAKDIKMLADNNINIAFVYFWYVLNSTVSYFCAYKQTLIEADQKRYIVRNIYMWFSVVLTVLQIAGLEIFSGRWYSYYVYLIFNIVFNILRNIYIAHKCNVLYPFIKVKEKTKMLKEDIRKLGKDIYSLFLYRISIVVMSGTDNIIIVHFVSGGMNSVGSYSNYNLLIGAVNALLSQVFESITASVGNLIAKANKINGNCAEEDNERAYKTFRALHFANFYFFGMCSVVFWVMLNPFIKWWIGKTDIIMLSPAVVFVLIANFYVCGIQTSTTAFRNAYGLFRQGRYRPVAMTIINLGLSLWWVHDYGMLGVFLGSLISRLATLSWFDPYVVHKYGFKRSLLPFLRDYILHITILLVLGWGTEWVVDLLPQHTILWLILRGIIAVIISGGVLLAIFGRTEEFKFIFTRIKGLIKKLKR